MLTVLKVAMRRSAMGWALALFACGPIVDVAPGSDAETGNSDDSTSTTGTTTGITMTTAGPSTTILDTSASVSISVSTTVEPTTDEPPPEDGGYCTPLCETPLDCCMGEPNCEAGLGTYPYNYGCENQTCTFGGCTSDEECTFGGVLAGYICVEVDGYAGCWPSCDSDQDCEDQFLTGWVCTGGGGTFCEQEPCVLDEDCPDDLWCQPETGLCFYPCGEDDICGGNGHCDPQSGGCVCSFDDECYEGYGCQPLP